MFAGTQLAPSGELARTAAQGVAIQLGTDTESSLFAGAIGGAQSELSERIRSFQMNSPVFALQSQEAMQNSWNSKRTYRLLPTQTLLGRAITTC